MPKGIPMNKETTVKRKGNYQWSEFKKLTFSHHNDEVVSTFTKLRSKLYSKGENVDQITNLIKTRIAELKAAK